MLLDLFQGRTLSRAEFEKEVCHQITRATKAAPPAAPLQPFKAGGNLCEWWSKNRGYSATVLGLITTLGGLLSFVPYVRTWLPMATTFVQAATAALDQVCPPPPVSEGDAASFPPARPPA